MERTRIATLLGTFYAEDVAFILSPLETSGNSVLVSCRTGSEVITTEGWLHTVVGPVELIDLFDALVNASALKRKCLEPSSQMAEFLSPQYVVRHVQLGFMSVYFADHAHANSQQITVTIFVHKPSGDSERLWECHAMMANFDSCKNFAIQLIKEVEGSWPGFFTPASLGHMIG